MEFNSVIPGIKVQPVAKAPLDNGQGLFRSETWKRAKRIDQPYLYVQLKKNSGDDELAMLGTEKFGVSGEWFAVSEFEKYVE